MKSCPLYGDEREAGYNGAVDCCSRIATLRTDYRHSGKQCGDDTENRFKWNHNHALRFVSLSFSQPNRCYRVKRLTGQIEGFENVAAYRSSEVFSPKSITGSN